jgi:hypothetical protein
MRCAHLDQIAFTQPPDQLQDWVECLRIGGQWVHLRIVPELRERRLL